MRRRGGGETARRVSLFLLNQVYNITMCSRDVPYPIDAARLRLSPFAPHGRLQDSIRLVRVKLKALKAGKSIGFTYVASLKSMGLVPRTNGEYRLGRKYCGVH